MLLGGVERPGQNCGLVVCLGQDFVEGPGLVESEDDGARRVQSPYEEEQIEIWTSPGKLGPNTKFG